MAKPPNSPDWLRPRGYCHFDPFVSPEEAVALATNPTAVSNHGFWPLIHRVKMSRRYKKRRGICEWKTRDIFYASHRDSAILSYYNARICEAYNAYLKSHNLDAPIIAYRKLGKSNVHFANEIFQEISKMGRCVALCFDVSAFFDTLDHRLLKDNMCTIFGNGMLQPDWYNVYWNVTRYSYVEYDDLVRLFGSLNPKDRGGRPVCSEKEFETRVRAAEYIKKGKPKGVPQGLPISGVLSNVYLIEADRYLLEHVNKVGGIYRRYSDDIIVVVPMSAFDLTAQLVPFAMKENRLLINEGKTEVVYFNGDGTCTSTTNNKQALQYLGLSYDGRRIQLRDKTVSRFHQRMRYTINGAVRKYHKEKALGSPSSFPKRGIYERFSHLGKSNFIRYAQRAGEITGSKAIRGQVRNAWPILKELLDNSTNDEEPEII